MHGFGNAGDGNAGIIFRVHVEVTGPAGSVGRFVACWSDYSKPTKEQAGHHSSKNRSGPHNEWWDQSEREIK
jgi:hypothetical protein